MFKAAFYKGQGNLFNRLIRWWDGGPYSHCELVFSDGMSASASYRDGQKVRMKRIEFDAGSWDFVVLPDELEAQARMFFEKTKDMKYDLLGQARFVYAPGRGDKTGYWCSEWIAAALSMPSPWRYGPNGLSDSLLLLQIMGHKQEQP